MNYMYKNIEKNLINPTKNNSTHLCCKAYFFRKYKICIIKSKVKNIMFGNY